MESGGRVFLVILKMKNGSSVCVFFTSFFNNLFPEFVCPELKLAATPVIFLKLCFSFVVMSAIIIVILQFNYIIQVVVLKDHHTPTLKEIIVCFAENNFPAKPLIQLSRSHPIATSQLIHVT